MRLNKDGNISLTFHIDAADRGVGIMSEDFSAWIVNPSGPTTLQHHAHMQPKDCYCRISDYNDDFSECKLEWHNSDTCDVCARPPNATIIEHALHGFARGMYASEEEFYEPIAHACEDDPELVSEDRPG